MNVYNTDASGNILRSQTSDTGRLEGLARIYAKRCQPIHSAGRKHNYALPKVSIL